MDRNPATQDCRSPHPPETRADGDKRPAATDLWEHPPPGEITQNTTVLTTADPSDSTDAHTPADRRTPLRFYFLSLSLFTFKTVLFFFLFSVLYLVSYLHMFCFLFSNKSNTLISKWVYKTIRLKLLSVQGRKETAIYFFFLTQLQNIM